MLILFPISLLASIVGAVCGIGGGVIIKPVLDLCRVADVATISFLSGCTVLSMTGYSVGKSLLAGEKAVSLKTGTPLALGAAAGGLAGKWLFELLRSLFARQDAVGAVQAACLALITLATLLYTLNRPRIRTLRVERPAIGLFIGLGLGVLSSFLGIGGGPINLMLLSYFYSMETKTAAANSLYIILFSQTASLLSTLSARSVPAFRWEQLLVMVLGGILGGILGRKLNQRISGALVDRLFQGVMLLIIGISAFNCVRFLRG